MQTISHSPNYFPASAVWAKMARETLGRNNWSVNVHDKPGSVFSVLFQLNAGHKDVVYQIYWSLGAIQCSREHKKFLKSISIHSNCSFMKPKQQTFGHNILFLECSLQKQEVLQLSSLMISTLVYTAIHTLLLSRK